MFKIFLKDTQIVDTVIIKKLITPLRINKKDILFIIREMVLNKILNGQE